MTFRLTAALMLAACAIDPSAAELEQGLSVPPELVVPDGNHVVASSRAFGFQIYECKADASGELAWTFRAPLGLLFADDDARVSVHFGGIDVGLPAGPYWQSTLDGSRVHGGHAVSVPNPGAIPLLRLQALDTEGDGPRVADDAERLHLRGRFGRGRRNRAALARSMCLASRAMRLSTSIGFARKSAAPCFIASTAVSTVA